MTHSFCSLSSTFIHFRPVHVVVLYCDRGYVPIFFYYGLLEHIKICSLRTCEPQAQTGSLIFCVLNCLPKVNFFDFYAHHVFFKIFLIYFTLKKIPIYRLMHSIEIYCNILNRDPCIVIRIVSPDSCQYTALFHIHLN